MTTALLLCSGPSARNAPLPDSDLLMAVNGAATIALEQSRRIDAWLMVEIAAGAAYGRLADPILAASPNCEIIVSRDTLKGRWAIDHGELPYTLYDTIHGADPEHHYMTSRRAPLPRTSGTCALYAMATLWQPERIIIVGMDGYAADKPLYADRCGSAGNAHPNQVLEAHRSNEHWYNRLEADLEAAGIQLERR